MNDNIQFTGPTICILPEEILKHIFSYLHTTDLNNVNLTNKYFYSLIANNTHTIKFKNWNPNKDPMLSLLQPTAKGEELFDYTKKRANNISTILINSYANLYEPIITCINSYILKLLEQFNNLQEINFNALPVNKETLDTLTKFSKLQSLIIEHKESPPLEFYTPPRIDLAFLSKLVSLTQISFSNLTLNNNEICHFSLLTNLQTFTVNNVGGLMKMDIDNNAFFHIAKLTNLTKLTITRSIIDNVKFLYLSTLIKLKELNLCGLNFLTNEGMLYLSSFTNLQNLNFKDIPIIRNNSVLYIPHLTNLQKISFDNLNISNDNFSHISNLTNLITVILVRLYITDEGLSYLSNLTNLTTISLGEIRNITNKGLLFLSTLTSLRELNLYNMNPNLNLDNIVESFNDDIKINIY